jgi:hypothetical protein
MGLGVLGKGGYSMLISGGLRVVQTSISTVISPTSQPSLPPWAQTIVYHTAQEGGLRCENGPASPTCRTLEIRERGRKKARTEGACGERGGGCVGVGLRVWTFHCLGEEGCSLFGGLGCACDGGGGVHSHTAFGCSEKAH